MKKSKYTEAQIIYTLLQVEAVSSVFGVCRKLSITEPAFYRWERKFAGMGMAELRRLRQLEEENLKLKQLVTDLSLDKHVLQEVLSKSSEAGDYQMIPSHGRGHWFESSSAHQTNQEITATIAVAFSFGHTFNKFPTL
jgi:putative transposase